MGGGSIDTVLFDMDGTLTHTDEVHFIIWQELLQRDANRTIDKAFYDAEISGGHNSDIIRRFVDSSWDDARVGEYDDMKEELFRIKARECGLIKPIPGLPALLEGIKQAGLKVGCVTNACRKNAEFMLECLRLTDYFDTLVIGAECTRPKPHPDPYQHAMRVLQSHPSKVCIFEDSLSGVQSAVASQASLVVGIRTTQTETVLRAHGAAWTIGDYTEVCLQRLVAGCLC